MKATIDLSAFDEDTGGVSLEEMKTKPGLYRASNPARSILLALDGVAYHCSKVDGSVRIADASWANHRYHRLAAKTALIRFSGD